MNVWVSMDKEKKISNHNTNEMGLWLLWRTFSKVEGQKEVIE